jgi:hypothetical protein
MPRKNHIKTLLPRALQKNNFSVVDLLKDPPNKRIFFVWYMLDAAEDSPNNSSLPFPYTKGKDKKRLVLDEFSCNIEASAPSP